MSTKHRNKKRGSLYRKSSKSKEVESSLNLHQLMIDESNCHILDGSYSYKLYAYKSHQNMVYSMNNAFEGRPNMRVAQRRNNRNSRYRKGYRLCHTQSMVLRDILTEWGSVSKINEKKIFKNLQKISTKLPKTNYFHQTLTVNDKTKIFFLFQKHKSKLYCYAHPEEKRFPVIYASSLNDLLFKIWKKPFNQFCENNKNNNIFKMKLHKTLPFMMYTIKHLSLRQNYKHILPSTQKRCFLLLHGYLNQYNNTNSSQKYIPDCIEMLIYNFYFEQDNKINATDLKNGNILIKDKRIEVTLSDYGFQYNEIYLFKFSVLKNVCSRWCHYCCKQSCECPVNIGIQSNYGFEQKIFVGDMIEMVINFKGNKVYKMIDLYINDKYYDRKRIKIENDNEAKQFSFYINARHVTEIEVFT